MFCTGNQGTEGIVMTVGLYSLFDHFLVAAQLGCPGKGPCNSCCYCSVSGLALSRCVQYSVNKCRKYSN